MVAGEKGLKTSEFSWITYTERLGAASWGPNFTVRADDHGPNYLLWLG